jgi:hypothetical protein|tara:strand:+ start:377 stop:646 length:270 start_codon:yes stop_codon:yes gene_type:complete
MDEENFDNEEIVVLTRNLNDLVENCLSNFDIGEMEVVQGRMKDLIEQSFFWLKKNNSKRFAYDLRDFLNWLRDYIVNVESEFWDEEEKN